MSIYTRRNAAVGYLTLRAVKHKLNQRRRRRVLRTSAYVGLGLLSAGVLAAVLFVALRRWHGDDAVASSFDGDDIVGEYVTAPEPAPAA